MSFDPSLLSSSCQSSKEAGLSLATRCAVLVQCSVEHSLPNSLLNILLKEINCLLNITIMIIISAMGLVWSWLATVDEKKKISRQIDKEILQVTNRGLSIASFLG